MKSYHSIQKYSEEDFGKYIYAFEKIDGSNFRAEWDRKLSKKTSFTNGFGKFGTRNEMIRWTNNPFYAGVDIFKKKFSAELDKIFREEKAFRGIDRMTVYGEFFGENSFAGVHNWNEPHDIKLFDIFVYKKDFVSPRDFLDIFGNLDICKLVYQGPFTQNFLELIQKNTFKLKEGVVCKGSEDKRIYMFKIKNDIWLSSVRQLFGDQKAEY
jgi:hypothetical protein